MWSIGSPLVLTSPDCYQSDQCSHSSGIFVRCSFRCNIWGFSSQPLQVLFGLFTTDRVCLGFFYEDGCAVCGVVVGCEAACTEVGLTLGTETLAALLTCQHLGHRVALGTVPQSLLPPQALPRLATSKQTFKYVGTFTVPIPGGALVFRACACKHKGFMKTQKAGKTCA